MGLKKRLAIFFLLAGLWTGLAPAAISPVLAALEPEKAILLGTGKVDITPPVGTPLAGFGKRRGKPSTGIHDPLYARALAIRRDGRIFVIVSADLVLIDAELREAVLKKIRRGHLLHEEDFVLCATHTHSGAGAIGGRFWERFIMGKRRKKVFEAVSQGIAQAAIQSLKTPTSAGAEYGEVPIDELVENRMEEKLRLPAKLKVLRFRSGEGKILGQLLFMAAHPTLLSKDNLLFSADFPGALAAALENESEGSVAVFINGAAGDLRPAPSGTHEERFQTVQAYGRDLAKKVRATNFQEKSLAGVWESVLRKEKLPRVKIRAGRLRVPSWIGNRFFPRHTFFQGIRMGPVLLLAFPGEVGSEMGYHIERRAAERNFEPLLVGYANDYIGYIIGRRHYQDRDHYEARASFYGKKLDWFFERKAEEVIGGLMSMEEKKALDPAGELSWKEGLPVLWLRGRAYHVGFEEGRLLKKEIRRGTDEIFDYFRSELPIPLLNRLIINAMLDRAWKKMEPYVTYDEYEQMRGIAKGAGVSFKKIKRIHALPEVYPTWCSNGAYWGPATKDGRLIAGRNLDWNRKIGIHRHAAVKFYLPSPDFPSPPWGEGRVRGYINIGYYGFAGVLSGMNEYGISVGQVGATSKDETMRGVPMPFLLKRVLEESRSLEDSVAVFKRSNLTRGYNYIIADAKQKEAIAVEATRSHLAVFRDNDPKERDVAYALPVAAAVFRGDPALDPTIRDLQWASKGNPEKPGLEPPGGSAYEIRYLKHGTLVKEHYGRIDAEVAKQIAGAIAPSSNIQSVIYAYPDFWVANAKGDERAMEAGYIRFSFDEFGVDKSSPAPATKHSGSAARYGGKAGIPSVDSR